MILLASAIEQTHCSLLKYHFDTLTLIYIYIYFSTYLEELYLQSVSVQFGSVLLYSLLCQSETWERDNRLETEKSTEITFIIYIQLLVDWCVFVCVSYPCAHITTVLRKLLNGRQCRVYKMAVGVYFILYSSPEVVYFVFFLCFSLLIFRWFVFFHFPHEPFCFNIKL